MIPKVMIPTDSKLKRFLIWREDRKETSSEQQQLGTNALNYYNKLTTTTTKVIDSLAIITDKNSKNRHSIAKIPTAEQSQQPVFSSATFPPQPQQRIISTKPTKPIKRKPLPKGCPQFELTAIKEKTLVLEDGDKGHQQRPQHRHSLPIMGSTTSENNGCLAEKMEIPSRRESRFYNNIPEIQAQLDRACRNEKVILIQKHYEQQRHKHLV